ncbi:MAG: DNA/RNA non-specific endonuclease [Bacteroidales bacterium]|nr:DNA/RNA non-specific endonuclease [Bacteroidales bacterium]
MIKRIKTLFILSLVFLSCGTKNNYALEDGSWYVEEESVEMDFDPADTTFLQNLEIPAHSSSEDLISHLGYALSYNHQTLTPNWVAYELTAEEVNGQLPRNNNFMEDPDLKGRQAALEDYRGSGWDRGHLAPAADMKWSQPAMDESFYLSNMCPQNQTFNGGSWEKTERMGRRIATKYGKVHIVSGPVYTSNQFGTIGANKVAIPDAFFKAFLIEVNGTYSAIGFLMQNTPEPQNLKASSMSVDSLESLIGLDLFHNLDDVIETEVEAKVEKKYWGI